MNIRLASPLQYDSIVDGPGVRMVIWTQGCPHNCLGCHNPNTHSCNGGFITTIDKLKEELSSYNQDGITLSGGEPFNQSEACLEIAKYAQMNGLNVWCYSGYTFEELLNMSKKNDIYMKLLEQIDVLVDGKYMSEFKNLSLKFRGSSNQRIIDVKESLRRQETVVIDKYNQIDIGLDLYQKPEYMFV